MPKLTYPGPAATVNVPSIGVRADRGKPTEVPEDAIDALVEQGWTTPAPAAKKADTAKKES